jgi:precorrin-8X/cobalt-precorrin-8 methylmutase
MPYVYETDGAAIYRQSFATIRAEADLARFTPDEERVAVRMIHAAGMVELAPHIRFSAGFAAAARAALRGGAPILCDARMVSEGITRARLPAANRVICTLHDAPVPGLAAALGTTRSAAALELWRPHLAGSVVAIGNAPTALFHLLTMLQDPACPRPAAMIGCPVGFVGAVRSRMRCGPGGRCPAASWKGGWAAARSPWRRSTPWRATRNERDDPRRRPGPRRGRPDERARRSAGARHAPHRLFPQGRAAGPCPPHRGRCCAPMQWKSPWNIRSPPKSRSATRATTPAWRRSMPIARSAWPIWPAQADVVVLCEGDPFFYGSFMHLHSRLTGQVPVQVVPGITGMAGAWNATGLPITWGDDVLTVAMATLPEAELTRRIRDTDALVVMKIGRNLPSCAAPWPPPGAPRSLAGGTCRHAHAARHPLAQAEAVTPYFAILLIHGQGRRP